jgi:AraC-like DNA-binding protein
MVGAYQLLCDTPVVRLSLYRCTAEKSERAITEAHARSDIALVQRGTFCYRSSGAPVPLVPGMALLGNAGEEYACSHEHTGGDECLVFQYGDAQLDQVTGRFRRHALPPLPRLGALGRLAIAAAEGRSSIGLEEIAYELAAQVGIALGQGASEAPPDRAADRARVVRAAEWIDLNAGEAIGLEEMANAAGLSPFHFVRLFRRQLGVTPHQYLVRARLRRAVALLLDTTLPVTEVGYAVGFADLSNFVRTFRRELGRPPGDYRRRKILQVDLQAAT